jgi:hypothetical protein
MNKYGLAVFIIAIATVAIVAGCSPNKALDFGPPGEITTPPQDKLSRDIIKEFDGRDFVLGHNDRQAEVRLPEWPEGKRVIIPFWLGVNPLLPFFLRPTLGHIYVISEAVLVRPLGENEYLIHAGSKMFKPDTILKVKHTRFLDSGKILPMVVRFVGTEVITVPAQPPAVGQLTEKVPLLREVSLPMRTDQPLSGYAKFEVRKNPA